MSKIVEKNGIIVGMNGDIAINENKFEDLLINSGFNIYDDEDADMISTDKVLDYAKELGFIAFSLYEDVDDFHFLLKLNDYEKIETLDNKFYKNLEKVVEDYVG